VAAPYLDPIAAQLLAFVPRVVGAGVTLIVGLILLRLALPAAREALRRAGIAQAAPFVVTAVTAAGWVVILSAAFQALGLSELALGLFGGTVLLVLLVAWTASGAAADLLSGLLLAQDPDFNVGARIRVGPPDHPLEGEIVALDLRKVRLRDAAGRLHVLPNRLVESAPWTLLAPAPPSMQSVPPPSTQD
jgi:small-conductance mechanosensitive channel